MSDIELLEFSHKEENEVEDYCVPDEVTDFVSDPLLAENLQDVDTESTADASHQNKTALENENDVATVSGEGDVLDELMQRRYEEMQAMTIEDQAEMVTAILKPVCITMAIVIIAVKLLEIPQSTGGRYITFFFFFLPFFYILFLCMFLKGKLNFVVWMMVYFI